MEKAKSSLSLLELRRAPSPSPRRALLPVHGSSLQVLLDGPEVREHPEEVPEVHGVPPLPPRPPALLEEAGGTLGMLRVDSQNKIESGSEDAPVHDPVPDGVDGQFGDPQEVLPGSGIGCAKILKTSKHDKKFEIVSN